MTTDPVFTDEQLLLTIVQAARVLAVSRTTVYELIKAGELHTVHLTRRCCRISRAEIHRYLARLDQAPPEPPPPPEPHPPRRFGRNAPNTQRTLFSLDPPDPGDPAAG